MDNPDDSLKKTFYTWLKECPGFPQDIDFTAARPAFLNPLIGSDIEVTAFMVRQVLEALKNLLTADPEDTEIRFKGSEAFGITSLLDCVIGALLFEENCRASPPGDD